MSNRPSFSYDEVDATEELYHHGVKGQKWGVRKRLKAGISAHNAKKAEANKPNSSYTDVMRSNDKRKYGKGGVKRINRDMNSGRSRSDAKFLERQRRQTKIAIAAAAAPFVAVGASIVKDLPAVLIQEQIIRNRNRNEARAKGEEAAQEALRNFGGVVVEGSLASTDLIKR